MTESSEKLCGNCKWWGDRGLYPHGLCKRHAPGTGESVFLGQKKAMWPMTGDRDWCGDFESVDKAAA